LNENLSLSLKDRKKIIGKHKYIRYAPKVAVVNSEAATTLYPETGSVLLKAARLTGKGKPKG
jgi:hypothetical protein